MRTMCSRDIFTKKCWQQQIFDSDLKGAWQPRDIYSDRQKFYVILYIDLYVVHSMCQTYDKSKGGDTRELQSRLVPPKKKLGRVTLNNRNEGIAYSNCKNYSKLPFSTKKTFKNRLFKNHHEYILRIQVCPQCKNSTRTGSAYLVNEIDMSQGFY